MPIPAKIKLRRLVGKIVVLDRDAATGQCLRVPAGTPMRVASIGRGMNLQSLDNPSDGVSYVLTDVRKADASLPEDPFGPPPYYGALWTDRARHGDYLWAECSACGNMLESCLAVNVGIHGTDYTGVKTRYCARCGARMGVRTATGKITVGKNASDRYGLEPIGTPAGKEG